MKSTENLTTSKQEREVQFAPLRLPSAPSGAPDETEAIPRFYLSEVLAGQRSCAVLALAVPLLLLLAACGGRDTSATQPSASFSANESDDAKAHLFTVPQEQMAHIQVVPVAITHLERVLRLTGTVTYNSFQTTPVITQVNGPVTRILAAPGQMVRAGQPLLYISSPDYAQMRSNFLKAQDAFQLAEKNRVRAQDLYDHHAIAEADLLQARSTWQQAQADLQAAVHALKVLGVTRLESLATDSPLPEVPVLAPIAGEVVDRQAAPGQVVQAGVTQIFTISDLSTVWVLANVYERDLGFVHVGDVVRIQSDAYPETFRGRISYVAAALDPASRTLQVRIVTRNPGEKLKKDMYVTAVVNAGEIPNALTVPDSAVLRNSENQPYVYIAENGPGQFGQRLVTLGESQDGKTQILSGLQAGERVVADGSLFLQFANSFQR